MWNGTGFFFGEAGNRELCGKNVGYDMGGSGINVTK